MLMKSEQCKHKGCICYVYDGSGYCQTHKPLRKKLKPQAMLGSKGKGERDANPYRPWGVDRPNSDTHADYAKNLFRKKVKR